MFNTSVGGRAPRFQIFTAIGYEKKKEKEKRKIPAKLFRKTPGRKKVMKTAQLDGILFLLHHECNQNPNKVPKAKVARDSYTPTFVHGQPVAHLIVAHLSQLITGSIASVIYSCPVTRYEISTLVLQKRLHG